MSNTAAHEDALTSPNEILEPNPMTSSQPKPPRHFKFPAHHDHMLSLAKMCKENKQFADCIIQSDNGFKHHAHRLVLGAASSFLTMIFKQVREICLLLRLLATFSVIVCNFHRFLRAFQRLLSWFLGLKKLL